MRIVVLLKDVPDLVEDLELDGDGRLLYDDLSYVLSEWDDQALEEALLIKEESQDVSVTVVMVDTGDVDTVLFTALAKGADDALKIVGDWDRALSNRQRAAIFAQYLKDHPADVVLTGVQAIDDVDGQIAGLVAGSLGAAHAAVVRDVAWDAGAGRLQFVQEYSGGRMTRFAAAPPLVLGVQAARKPPRYVTVSRIRQLSKSAVLEEVEASVPEVPLLSVERLARPEQTGHAVMWDGSVEDVADRIRGLLQERNLLRS